ncbi:hypothetical protein V8F20_000336 [Naviculisporaceae sp. PSN 640]
MRLTARQRITINDSRRHRTTQRQDFEVTSLQYLNQLNLACSIRSFSCRTYIGLTSTNIVPYGKFERILAALLPQSVKVTVGRPSRKSCVRAGYNILIRMQNLCQGLINGSNPEVLVKKTNTISSNTTHPSVNIHTPSRHSVYNITNVNHLNPYLEGHVSTSMHMYYQMGLHALHRRVPRSTQGTLRGRILRISVGNKSSRI